MDYQKIYDQLMQKRKSSPPTGYTENHHIIPRCMGGDDRESNLVELTAREHYIAHKLLFKIHRTTKLAHAWFSMFRVSDGQQRNFNSRMYDECRNARSQLLSKEMKGEGNHFYGRKHTETTKRKISEAHTGKRLSPEVISNWVEKVASKPKSEEHRRKIGRKGMVMLQNKNTLEIRRVDKNEAKHLGDEWVNPRTLIPEKKYKCDYCDVVTNKGNLNRWHNERCKQRPIV